MRTSTTVELTGLCKAEVLACALRGCVLACHGLGVVGSWRLSFLPFRDSVMVGVEQNEESERHMVCEPVRGVGKSAE